MDAPLLRRHLLLAGTASLGLGSTPGRAAPHPAASDDSAAADLDAVVAPPPALQLADGLRLATCLFPGAKAPSLGLVRDDGHIVDLAAGFKRLGLKARFATDSMLSLLEAGPEALAQVRQLDARAASGRLPTHALQQVRLLSPIPKPHSNIYCVGWNYLEHFNEGKDVRADKGVSELPAHPVFFTKSVHTMNHPLGSIPYEVGNTETADYEAELAVIIGKTGRNIPEEQAMDYVFGYTAYNDTTVREIQQKRHGGQWFKGKSLDRYGPMGPWIVSADGVDLSQVRVICRINGVEKQNASYETMYFKVPRIIAELSRGLTLVPGDIIATGTPPGVGYARKPPEFLRPDDVIETEVTGIGSFKNIVRLQS